MNNNSDNKNNSNGNFIKIGFSKLIKSFEGSIKEVEKITKTFGLVLKIHSNEVRKYQNDKIEPQINHLLRVALILAEEIKVNDSETVCSALLHDIFNKDKVSQEVKNYIKKEISEKIFNTISFFVKSNSINSNGNSQQLTEKRILKIKQADPQVRLIVLAERLDEIRALKNSRRKEKIARVKEETQKYYLPLAESTNEKILLKLIIAMYELK
jgi:(p)ppGpp synthase/HD superfamily hydrolase